MVKSLDGLVNCAKMLHAVFDSAHARDIQQIGMHQPWNADSCEVKGRCLLINDFHALLSLSHRNCFCITSSSDPND